METAVNIQNSFFNQARKDRAKVVVYLANGTKLVGRIKSFDKFTVILESGNGEQMIFKHAISTVSAHRSFGNYIPMDKARSTAARGAETRATETPATETPATETRATETPAPETRTTEGKAEAVRASSSSAPASGSDGG